MITYATRGEKKRVKVLHVITHLGVGGALDNTLLTVERLPARALRGGLGGRSSASRGRIRNLGRTQPTERRQLMSFP